MKETLESSPIPDLKLLPVVSSGSRSTTGSVGRTVGQIYRKIHEESEENISVSPTEPPADEDISMLRPKS